MSSMDRGNSKIPSKGKRIAHKNKKERRRASKVKKLKITSLLLRMLIGYYMMIHLKFKQMVT